MSGEANNQPEEQTLPSPSTALSPDLHPNPRPKILLMLLTILLITSALLYAGIQIGRKQVKPTSGPMEDITPTDVAVYPTLAESLDQSQAEETAEWKTYRNAQQGYLIKYPKTWILDDTVFSDENGKKIAEFAPGHMTPKESISCSEYFNRVINGGPDIEAPETNMSFSQPSRNELVDQDVRVIKGVNWYLLVTKTGYKGGYPEWTGIWYPHHYCTTQGNRLFLVNFYERALPSRNKELFELILSTFKFLD